MSIQLYRFNLLRIWIYLKWLSLWEPKTHSESHEAHNIMLSDIDFKPLKNM